jgi:hypothetical protein
MFPALELQQQVQQPILNADENEIKMHYVRH